MKEYTHKIMAEHGLHARPAGALARLVRDVESSVKVRAMGKEADAKRLLSLMSLGATTGAELYFVIDGADEETAYEKIKEFCEREL